MSDKKLFLSPPTEDLSITLSRKTSFEDPNGTTTVSVFEKVLDAIRFFTIMAQMFLMMLVSHSMINDFKSSEKTISTLSKIDLGLLAFVFLHLADVIINIVIQGPISYFQPTLYYRTRKAHCDEICNTVDFLIAIYSFTSWIMVVIVGKNLSQYNNNDNNDFQCLEKNYSRYWYAPWNIFSGECAVKWDINFVDYHRIWLCLSILRIFLVVPFSRRVIYALGASFAKMTSLFSLMFAVLFAFGVIGVTFFRQASEYQDVHLFQDLSSAFAAFAQLQVGEAFFEVLCM